MITLPYTSRDYETIFNGIKDIIQTLEPRADVDFDKANVESIIAKVISGCVDTLSYNQDANILEAFPSTARDSRAVFDLLSIVGYTPKTARCCMLDMSLWNPSFTEERVYVPYNYISLDGKIFYNVDEFRIAPGITAVVKWYQGTVHTPDKRTLTENNVESFIDNYYPNLSVSTIKDKYYNLNEEHTMIDSRTVKVYSSDGTELTYVENPYMTNITKSSFSIEPRVNSNGYRLVFSKDVVAGCCGNNLYYFYITSDNEDVGDNLIPDFGGLAVNNEVPSFSHAYNASSSHKPETANEARENIVYKFGWRDTPKSIVTKYDAERAVLQLFDFISAVKVKDGNDYSRCNPSLLDVQVFCKVNETTEHKLNISVADGIKNRILTHIHKFKILPLNFTIHVDNIITEEGEIPTELYYWFPDITIYLKEQVNPREAAAILNAVDEALFKRFATINMDFNEVPRIVDIIETVQNASDIILYLDIDGVNYMDKDGKNATKTDITCAFNQKLPLVGDLDYSVLLDTKGGTRCIEYHSVRIFDAYNNLVAYDNGDGTIIAYGSNFNGHGTIDYKTGELKFALEYGQLDDNHYYNISYRQETPTFCEFVNTKDSIKIATESLKA